MIKDRKMNVGIGFATGRKNFKRVLNTYIYNWKECGLIDSENIKLNLLIAYDLKYNKTKPTDYTLISENLTEKVDSICFLDAAYTANEKNELIEKNILTKEEAELFFSSGYAAMRNTVLYAAVKNKIDYLLFLDDDEYPVAVTKTRSTAIWGGQHILEMHLNYIQDADITNGHHCGYISPIPYVTFNDVLTENDFRVFIEAISNDIITWDSILSIMNNGGVTYADTKVLVSDIPEEVQEIRNTKFISGANLCINLTDPKSVKPFYNPPGARGEDTFLSACLKDKKVLRVPCYAFHDGFSTYNHLMSGVLPVKLKRITADSKPIITRFYNACIGWVRYKPLLLYITQRENYNEKIKHMKESLAGTIPKLCSYFNTKDFVKILKELDNYDRHVEAHYEQFLNNQKVWAKLNEHLSTINDYS